LNPNLLWLLSTPTSIWITTTGSHAPKPSQVALRCLVFQGFLEVVQDLELDFRFGDPLASSLRAAAGPPCHNNLRLILCSATVDCGANIIWYARCASHTHYFEQSWAICPRRPLRLTPRKTPANTPENSGQHPGRPLWPTPLKTLANAPEDHSGQYPGGMIGISPLTPEHWSLYTLRSTPSGAPSFEKTGRSVVK